MRPSPTVLRGLLIITCANATALATAHSQSPARAASPVSPWPRVLSTQVNVIGQRLGSFASPYQGANSLLATGDREVSHVYGLYLGAEPLGWGGSGARRARVQLYVDVEMALGHGISSTTGLAGVTNGDVLRAGSTDLGHVPYVARAFARFVQPLRAGHDADTLTRAMDQLPTVTSARRIELTVGKLAASDVFDVNRYANTTRTQFMNWGLFQNSAWDFAADTRGYTNGITAAWITPRWAARLGSFQMPTKANGNVFDGDIRHVRGDNAELTLFPGGASDQTRWPTVRVLGFVNHARMGRYASELAVGQAAGSVPDIAQSPAPNQSGRAVDSKSGVQSGARSGDGREPARECALLIHRDSGDVQGHDTTSARRRWGPMALSDGAMRCTEGAYGGDSKIEPRNVRETLSHHGADGRRPGTLDIRACDVADLRPRRF